MLAPILFLAYISNIGEDTLVYVGDTEVKNGVKTWWKRVKKFGQGSPPPLFGQCPKENILFFKEVFPKIQQQLISATRQKFSREYIADIHLIFFYFQRNIHHSFIKLLMDHI